jgi:hypothetical protein
MKRLFTRFNTPPLFMVPLIILATAQTPIIAAVNPTTVNAVLEISELLVVVVVEVALDLL